MNIQLMDREFISEMILVMLKYHERRIGKYSNEEVLKFMKAKLKINAQINIG